MSVFNPRRELGPTRASRPTEWATSSMLALVSHMPDSALIDETRWAKVALAANLDSSDDERPTVRMRPVLGWYHEIRSGRRMRCGE